MDSVGHEVTHKLLKSLRKVDGKEARKEMAKETQKGGKHKGGKGGNQEKCKGKGKDMQVSQRTRRICRRTVKKCSVGTDGRAKQTAQNGRKQTFGQDVVDTPWSRVPKASAVAEEFQPATVGERRLSNLGFDNEKEWNIGAFQHDRVDPSQRTITFGIDTAAC